MIGGASLVPRVSELQVLPWADSPWTLLPGGWLDEKAHPPASAHRKQLSL